MRKWARCVLLGLLSFSVALLSGVVQSDTLFGETCPATLENFKNLIQRNELLPSLDDRNDGVYEFELVKLDTLLGGFSYPDFKFPLANVPQQQTRAVRFDSLKDLGNAESYSVRQPDGGFATLYRAHTPPTANGTSDTQFFSGFLYVPGSTAVKRIWVFVELLEPLLRLYDAGLADCSRNDRVHIVYNADYTEFRMELEPSAAQQAQSESLRAGPIEKGISYFEKSLTSAIDSSTLIPLLGVADQQLLALYPEGGSKEWHQAIGEVLDLVEKFYENTVEGLDLIPMPRGPLGDMTASLTNVNGYNLLCFFAQGIVINDTNGDTVLDFMDEHQVDLRDIVLPDGTVAVDSDIWHEEIPPPMIAHLFTGHQLQEYIVRVQDVPLSDSGCCICHSDDCGEWKGRIVGLAEGIGQLWNQNSSLCLPEIPTDLSSYTRDRRHHSLSQAAPMIPPVVPSCVDGVCICESGTCNFDDLLIQSFLLATHEIGHVLGAEHSVDNTAESCYSSNSAAGGACKSIMTPDISTLNGDALTFGIGDSFDKPRQPEGESISNVQRITECLADMSKCDK